MTMISNEIKGAATCAEIAYSMIDDDCQEGDNEDEWGFSE